MILKNDKKGVVIFSVLAFIFIALLIIYIVLHFPIPAFATIRSIINYAMVILFWITLQVTLIYGYFKLGVLVAKGMNLYRGKMHLWTINVKNFMLARR